LTARRNSGAIYIYITQRPGIGQTSDTHLRAGAHLAGAAARARLIATLAGAERGRQKRLRKANHGTISDLGLASGRERSDAGATKPAHESRLGRVRGREGVNVIRKVLLGNVARKTGDERKHERFRHNEGWKSWWKRMLKN
jgi:hypothetical protein